MKFDYQKNLAKSQRSIISRKKTYNYFENRKLNFKSHENAKFSEQCTEKCKNRSFNNYDS